MKIEKLLLASAAFCAASLGAVPLEAASRPLQVAASSTLAADLVRKIGGDRVEVRSVASPKFNAHFYQPTPKDVRNVSRADLYVHWGLDLEAWSDPLLEAAGRPELFRGGPRNVDLSVGIRLLDVPQGVPTRADGDIHLYGNPHYQMDPRNAAVMARTIARRLGETDPEGASAYAAAADAFLAELERRTAEWKAACAHCDGSEIVSYHKDVVYFADFLGLKVERTLEPKPGIPPTPKHLESLETYIRQRRVRAITISTYFPKDTAERLAARTGARVVTICQNAGEREGTEDFFAFHEHNVRQIGEALAR